MGLGDRLKGLREQAQQAVVENREKIQDAVQVVGEAANTRTHGRYATKIAKVGAKVEESVDRVAGAPTAGDAATAATEPGAPTANDPATAATEPAAPTATEPAAPTDPTAPVTPKPAATGFPEFD